MSGADTDGDGLFDGDEAGAPSGDEATIRYVGWSDPLRPDSDDDGLSDADEMDFALTPRSTRTVTNSPTPKRSTSSRRTRPTPTRTGTVDGCGMRSPTSPTKA